MQSKLVSLIEVVVNVGIGFVVAYFGAVVIYPWYGMEQPSMVYFELTVLFTVLSLIRAYIVRRFFNGPFHLWLMRLQDNANKN